MKRLIKAPFRFAWRLTHPVRAPLARKFEAMVARGCATGAAQNLSIDTHVLMDHMIRELVRLQTKVDRLEHMIADFAPANTGLGLVGEDEGEEEVARSAAG